MVNKSALGDQGIMRLEGFHYKNVSLKESHWKTQRDGLVWQQCLHLWTEAGSFCQAVSGDRG